MTRKIAAIAALFLVAAAGCDDVEPQPETLRAEVEVRSTAPATTEKTEAYPTGVTILASIDGSVQEEVVHSEGTLPCEDDALAVEIPEIVIMALSETPRESESSKSFIVRNEDGSVQEEVVFTDSVDDADGTDGDIVAFLSKP